MKTKHTPGPWVAEAGTTTGRQVIAPNAPKTKRVVARFGGPDRDGNSLLAATAPELLAELKRMVEHFSTWASDHSDEATAETWAALHCARTVIARTERTQP